jgi:hypothetical protein
MNRFTALREEYIDVFEGRWGSREARRDAVGKSKGLLRTSSEPDAQAQSSRGAVLECGFEGPVYGRASKIRRCV